MYKKALVPLDGSELAECTLTHVESLFKDGSIGEVTLLNVVKIDIPWAELEAGKANISKLREQASALSQKYLKEVEARLGLKGLTVKKESLEGARPADTITEYAQKNGIGLIIMGTHGRTGFKKLMLGSVASSVLEQSHVPVLLVRPEACRV